MKPLRKLKLEHLEKQIDDWKNNQYAHVDRFKLQALTQNMPEAVSNFQRDKGKDVDAGDRFNSIPGHEKNKRRRRRDIIENPKKVIGSR